MYKYLFALAVMTGSFASYADMYNKESSTIDNSRRTDKGYYEDKTSVSDSATVRTDSMDSTVTGTMPDMSSEGLIAQKWHVGVTSGYNASDEDRIDNAPSFGVDIGYQPSEFVGAGLEAFTAKQEDAVSDVQRTTALMKGTFHIGGDIPVLNTAYVGAGVGPIFISNRVRWAGAPMVGFDIPLTQKAHDFLSLGLNAKYIFTTDNADTPQEFASAVALKYWF